MTSLSLSPSDILYRKYEIPAALEILKRYGYAILFNVSEEDRKGILNWFGKLINQYGKEDYIVCPNTNLYSANSSSPLYPHTDRNEYDNISIYLSLYVRSVDRSLKGLTEVCYMRDFVFSTLSQKERDFLMKKTYFITPNDNLKKQGAAQQYFAGPLLTIDKGDWTFRFSVNFTHSQSGDKFFENIKYKVIDFYNKNRLAVHLPENSLLILENHHCLHGRSDIIDLNRELVRNYIEPHKS